MEKSIISYYPESSTGALKLVNPSVMEKTAGVADTIVSFLNSLTPIKGKSYALVNALSSGENYGSNLNGDYFADEELRNYHKTFEALGHIYELHQNKDPKKSLGRVLFSFYNPVMKRVELIVEFDDVKAKHILDKIKEGETLSTSMGTRVSYEKCSICGHISKTLAQRCDHLKYEMNKIYPDGRKVFAYNYAPKFFDISVVRIPADKTSRVVRMIRIVDGDTADSKKIVVFEKKLASKEKNVYNKAASFETSAEIAKEVSAKIEKADFSKDPKQLAQIVKARLDKNVLYKLSEYPLKDTLSTMLALRIMPSPEDFQKLALYSLGEKELAEKLFEENITFDLKVPETVMVLDGLKLENVNEKIASLLGEDVPLTSSTELWNLSEALLKVAKYMADGTWKPDQPKADQRSLVSKLLVTQEDEPTPSPVKNPIVPLGILGSLYYGYMKVFKNTSSSGFKKFLSKYPWLVPVVVGGAAIGSNIVQTNNFVKSAGFMDRTFRSGLISFPVSYYLSADKESAARRGKEMSNIDNFVRKHPALTGLLFTAVGNLGQKRIGNLLKIGKKEELVKIAEILLQIDQDVIQHIQKDLLEAI